MNRHLRIVAGIVALIVVATGGLYAFRNPEHDAIETARAGAPGQFAHLSQGVTHYELIGADSARTIVLVHGFSVPYYIWDSTATALSAAGYRVLRYDEYGRGLSDRPSVDYTAELYDNQLSELLDSLHVAGKIDLAGVSMGGWVTGSFAGRHPARVRSLVLVDPVAGTSSGSLGMFGIPVIGSYLWQVLAVPTMAEGQTGDLLEPTRFPGWADRYRPQTRIKGFGHALLSTRRATAGVSMDSVYRTVAAAGIPVLLLWGRADHTVDFAKSASVRQAIPTAEFHPIDRAAHLPILEQAPLADSLILDFLARHPRQ